MLLVDYCLSAQSGLSVAAVYGAVATPSELTIVTDLVKRGPLRAILDDRGKRDSLTASTRHRIIKVWPEEGFPGGRFF